MGDLLKNFSDHPPRPIQACLPPPSPASHQTQERKPKINFPHLDKSRHVSTTAGPSTHTRGRVGKKDRIIDKKNKQEKAYLKPLERQRQLPTVGEREK
jgi:hypothetical protein